MAFFQNVQVRQVAASTPALVPGAAAMIGFDAGQVKVTLENTGAAAAGDSGMQFNISGTIGA